MTGAERTISDLWHAGALLADICIALRMSARAVMDEVRRLRLPERHLTTGEIMPGTLVDAPSDSPSASRPEGAL